MFFAGQVSQDTDMNVLEAILGDGDEAKDDFDNEIANTNSAKKGIIKMYKSQKAETVLIITKHFDKHCCK